MNNFNKKQSISYILIIVLVASLCFGLIPSRSFANDSEGKVKTSESAIIKETKNNKEDDHIKDDTTRQTDLDKEENNESEDLNVESRKNSKISAINSEGDDVTSKLKITSLNIKYNSKNVFSEAKESGISINNEKPLFSLETSNDAIVEIASSLSGKDQHLSLRGDDIFSFDLGAVKGNDLFVKGITPYGFDLLDKKDDSKIGEGIFEFIKKAPNLYLLKLKASFTSDRNLKDVNFTAKIDGNLSSKVEDESITVAHIKAKSSIKPMAVDTEDTLQNKINNSPNNTETTIELNNDINITKSLSIPSNKNIKLVGDYSLKRTNAFTNGPIITNNGTLTIDGITVDGANISITKLPGIYNKGNLVLNSGSIQNCQSNAENPGKGGGIESDGPSAKITMNGGTIKNNRGEGGGVRLVNGSQMTMYNGVIEDNYGYWGGAICLISANDRLTIYAGTIQNNYAVNAGGGIYTHYDTIFTAYNLLITKNNGRSQGGGLWVCEKGNGKTSKLDGMACFGNTGRYAGDDFFKKPAEVDTSSIDLSENMIGGGTTKWYKDGPEEYKRYDPSNPEQPGSITGIKYATALKSIPSESSIQLALQHATTIITGNNGGMGGGIGNNGKMQLGLSDIPQKISINVNKEWKNDAGKESKRPKKITVQLLKKGTEIGNPVDLDNDNGWSHKFDELPLSSTEVPQDYTIEEVAVSGYQTTLGALTNVDSNGNYKITLTNTKEDSPNIRTNAVDATTNTSKGAVGASGNVRIVDTVNYENLTPNTDYIINGVLMIKDESGDGIPFLVDGHQVTGSAIFTPTTASGIQEVIFEFDGSKIDDNTSFVVFEKLFLNGQLNDPVATHEDIDDEGQTVTYSNKKEISVEKEWNIPSGYGIVTPNSITIKLYLDGTETNRAVTLHEQNGWEDVFENIPYESEVSIAEDDTPSDYEASYTTKAGVGENMIYVAKNRYKSSIDPQIRTNATDGTTGTSRGSVGTDGKVKIVDNVSYEKLNTTKEYTLIGTIMKKDGSLNGLPLLVDGNPVTSSAVFTPATSNGTQSIIFEFDGSKLNDNTSLVVFEELYIDGEPGVPVAEHEEINDEKQTVTIAHKKEVDVEKEWNIPSGYDISTPNSIELKLHLDGSATDRTVILDEQSKWEGVFDEVPYQSNVTISEVDTPNNYNAKYTTKAGVNGSTIYVAENTYSGSTVPSIRTKAVDGSTNTSKGSVGDDGKVKIVDTVSYERLNTNKEYTLEGTIMIKDETMGGTPLIVDGRHVTGSAVFTPNTTNGTQQITFEFDGSKLNDNTSLVVFEKLFIDGQPNTPVSTHENIDDPEQTVTYSHKKKVDVEKEWVIPQGYGIVTPDSITLKLYLDGKDSNKTVILNEQKSWKDEFEDIPYESDVSISEVDKPSDYNVAYTTKANITGGVTYVVENAYKNSTDPRIETSASDGTTNTSQGSVGTDRKVKIIDTVSYERLNTTKEYTLTGTLMVNDGTPTGKPLLIGGGTVTSSAVFTPSTSNGTQKITFEFDGSELNDETTLVVFEKLFIDGDPNTPVADHENINAEGQTVTIAHKKDVNVEKEWNIPPGYGVITPSSIEMELYLNGVQANKTVTLNEQEGWKGAFKNIPYDSEVRIAEVNTPSDYHEQYITKAGIDGALVYVAENTYNGSTEPGIKTQAEDGTTKTSQGAVGVDGKVKIVDTVSYERLDTTKRYTLIGTIMVKDGSPTGKPLLVKGQEVTGSAVFAPQSTNGTEDITFEFDGNNLKDGVSLVVFEELYIEGQPNAPVADHKNINDVGQTVTYSNKKEVAVEKVWSGLSTKDGIVTSDAVDVELYLNGSPSGITEKLDDNNNWSAVFKNISNDIPDDKIEIIEIDGDKKFNTTYEKHSGSNGKLTKIIITNTGSVPDDKTSLNVSKSWDIPKDKKVKIPDYVKVKLLKDEIDTGIHTILSDINGWSDSFAGLDTNSKYTVVEDKVKSFRPEYKISTQNGDTIVELTNHFDDSHPEPDDDSNDNKKQNDKNKSKLKPKTSDTMILVPLFILVLMAIVITVSMRKRKK